MLVNGVFFDDNDDISSDGGDDGCGSNKNENEGGGDDIGDKNDDAEWILNSFCYPFKSFNLKKSKHF